MNQFLVQPDEAALHSGQGHIVSPLSPARFHVERRNLE